MRWDGRFGVVVVSCNSHVHSSREHTLLPFAVFLYTSLLVSLLVHSQDLGPEDCTTNVSLSTGTIEIPPGTVCVECIVNGEVVDDAQFQLQGSNIDPSKGRTVDGVLILFETEDVFVPNATPILRCSSSSDSSVNTLALVVFVSKSHKSSSQLHCQKLKIIDIGYIIRPVGSP